MSSNYEIHVEAQLHWPSLLSNTTISFPTTLLGNTSVSDPLSVCGMYIYVCMRACV